MIQQKLEELRKNYQHYLDFMQEEGDEYDKLADKVREEFEDLFYKYLTNAKITVSTKSEWEISDADIDYYAERFIESEQSIEDLIADDIVLTGNDVNVRITE